ncbi:MAG: type II toxin-antitoxin system YafQ family toxin [Alphaproteobacteria bacterium]|nr:type II toxin-antitoxin system YafQ family toxin [Alphaproteobacteria bacterium]
MKIKFSKKFKRDYKRELSGIYGKKLQSMIDGFLDIIEYKLPFPYHYRDHALTGEWNDYRDCHLKPDLVLIYRKTNDNELELVRLGSHSELGL